MTHSDSGTQSVPRTPITLSEQAEIERWAGPNGYSLTMEQVDSLVLTLRNARLAYPASTTQDLRNRELVLGAAYDRLVLERTVQAWSELIPWVSDMYTITRPHQHVSMSDLGMEGVEALCMSEGEETTATSDDMDGEWRVEPVTLVLMSYSDYHGSDLDAANAEYLMKTYPVRYTCTNHHMGQWQAEIDLGKPLVDCDEILSARLVEEITSNLRYLADFPLLSEECHSEYVEDQTIDAWSGYIRYDLLRDLRRLASSTRRETQLYNLETKIATDDDQDRKLMQAYLEECPDTEVVMDSATSVAVLHSEDGAHYIARTVLGWDIER